MAVAFDLFQVSASNPELHATLADSHRHVASADARSFLGVDLFQHAYDPTAWRAWLLSARAPMFSGVLAPVPPAARLATAVASNGGGQAVEDLDGGPAQQAFLAAHPYVGKLEALISAQSPARQRELVLACVGAVMNAVKSINLNLYAFKPYRTLCERVWGYYAQGSDPYWVGISGSDINALLRGGVGTAATTWRGTAARRWATLRTTAGERTAQGRDYVGRIDHRDPVEPYCVVFGSPADYQGDHHGCHVASGGSIGMPIACVAPTVETHTLWCQANGTISGGAFPSALVDWRGWVFEAVQWEPQDILGARVGGRYRLFAAPPLYLYWAMFYLPQPEFADASGNPRNFIEWMLAQRATELIRSTRVGVILRNSAQATRHGIATVEALVGRAELDEVQSEQDKNAIRSAVSGLVGGASVALSTAVPLAGLIGGVASVVGLLIASAGSGSPDATHSDIFGGLMPGYLQFAILPSREALFEARCPGIGWPVGVVPSGQRVGCPDVTDEMVAAAEATRFQGGYVAEVAYASGTAPPAPGTLLPAPTPLWTAVPDPATMLSLARQYVELRVDGMPPYGGVFLDGGAVPLAGRWLDPSERVWIVQAPRGRHQLRVAPPSGGGPERTMALDLQGPTTVSFEAMAPPSPSPGAVLAVHTAPPRPANPPAAPPSSSGGGWLAGLLLTSVVVGGGALGWKYRRRLLAPRPRRHGQHRPE